MAKKEKTGKFLQKWNKIIKWYGEQAYAVGIIYSVGAAIVIIGALFKILHWPGASQVLMVGMFTEAFLFILGIFEKPHAAYHWENLFPELVHEVEEVKEEHKVEKEHKPAKLGGVSALSQEDVDALQIGISNLTKAAGQLSTLSDVANATDGLVVNMNAASEAAGQFVTSQATLSTSVEGVAQQYKFIETQMAGVASQTKIYESNVEALNAQLTSINSVYELQLKDIQAQSIAYKAQIENLGNLNTTISDVVTQSDALKDQTMEAVAATKLYTAAQQKLAEQIADLNKVYGNMLNAL